MKGKGDLFIISAPSGAGKTSLVKALLNDVTGIEVSVSHTTRQQRQGEQPGSDYHFVSQEKFQEMIDGGEFFEHAQVFDNFYGTSKRLIEQKRADGIDIILEIDWQGAQQIRSLVDDCCSLFILPPSKGVLEQRLCGRGQDSDEVIARRMQTAVAEMSHYQEYDYLIINDNFDVALLELTHVILAKRAISQRQTKNHADLIHKLLN